MITLIQHIICIINFVKDVLIDNSPVEISIPHNDSAAKVTFGSSLKKDPCLASYAVDDLMVYVK